MLDVNCHHKQPRHHVNQITDFSSHLLVIHQAKQESQSISKSQSINNKSNNQSTKTGLVVSHLSSLILGHHHQGNLTNQPTSHGRSNYKIEHQNQSEHPFLPQNLEPETYEEKPTPAWPNQNAQRDSHCTVQSSPYSTRIRKSPLYLDFELATASKPRQTSLVTPQSTSNLTFKHGKPTISTVSTERQEIPINSNSTSTQASNPCKQKLLQKH